MPDLPPHYRRATEADAADLASLVNMAGEGLPVYLWEGMATEGQSPWEIGRQRARRDKGAFSFRHAVVRDEGGMVTAALIGYPLAAVPEPWDAEAMPPMFVPLQELEDLAAKTWYVNTLATVPAQRGRGIGAELLGIAGMLAADTKRSGLSLIVSDGNLRAQALYEREGFRVSASRPMIKEGWENPGENWVLMVQEPVGQP